MTTSEARQFLEYAATIYPSARMPDAQMEHAAKIWANEFDAVSLKRIGEAFKIAQIESPKWMPSVPEMHAALNTLDSMAKPRTPEDEFRDAHGGKSRAEWEAYNEWASSQSGKAKIEQYKQRLKQLVGV